MQTSELTHNRHVVSTFECQTCLTRFFAWNLLETSFGCRCVANDCETYLKRLSVADVCPMIAKPTWNVFRLQMCAQWLRNLLETSFGCRCVPNDCETYLKRLSVADVCPMIGSLSQIVKITSVIGRKLQEVSSLVDHMLFSLPSTSASAWELERKEIGGLEKSFEVGKKVMWPLVIYQCSQVCMYICEMYNLEWSRTVCFTYSVVVLCAIEYRF